MSNNRIHAMAKVLSTTLILAGAFSLSAVQPLKAQTSTPPAAPSAPPASPAPPAPTAPEPPTAPAAPAPAPNTGPPPPPSGEQVAPAQGTPPQGMPPQQVPQQGMPPQGMPQQGMPQEMPPGMIPQPVEPPAAILYKPGHDVTTPAQLNVSGVAAIVNGEKITNQQLVTAFLKNGGQPTLTEMITNLEMEQAARKAHITVSETEIDSRLQDTRKQFTQRIPGKTWSDILSSKGLSEHYARTQTRLQLLAEKLSLSSQPPYSLAGKIHIYHILIATVPLGNQKAPHTDTDAKALIDKIRSDISSGKITFQAAAKQYSDDFGTATKGGDLDWVSNQDPLDPAFKTAAFALKQGEISQPVKSQFGYHIILMAKNGDSATPTEVKAASASSAQQRAQQFVGPYMQQLQGQAAIQDLLIPLPSSNPAQPMIAMPHFTRPAPIKKTPAK